MISLVYYMGILIGIAEYVFIILGIFCFIKYLRDKNN